MASNLVRKGALTPGFIRRGQEFPVVDKQPPSDTTPEELGPELSPAEYCSLEVQRETTEVERPTWVALLTFLQLQSPELSLAIAPALDIGSVPVRPVILGEDAAASVNWFIESVWGRSDLVIPLVVYSTSFTDVYGLPTPRNVHGPIQPCAQLPVLVQTIEVTTCSPYESRVLNVKSKYPRLEPVPCLELGLELLTGSVSRPKPVVPPVPTRPTKEKKSRYSWVIKH